MNKLPPFFFSYNPSFAAKFWEKVNKHGPYSEECGSDCWEWIGSRDELGYGIVGNHISFDGKTIKKAYRIAYILWYGEIPEKAHVRHLCNYPSCVRPHHLKPGTPKENVHDAIRRGTHRNGRQFNKGENHWMAKLSNDKRKEIYKMYMTGNYTQDELAVLFHTSQKTVYRIVNDTNWSA